jgi:hypothetical protein
MMLGLGFKASETLLGIETECGDRNFDIDVVLDGLINKVTVIAFGC